MAQLMQNMVVKTSANRVTEVVQLNFSVVEVKYYCYEDTVKCQFLEEPCFNRCVACKCFANIAKFHGVLRNTRKMIMSWYTNRNKLSINADYVNMIRRWKTVKHCTNFMT